MTLYTLTYKSGQHTGFIASTKNDFDFEKRKYEKKGYEVVITSKEYGK